MSLSGTDGATSERKKILVYCIPRRTCRVIRFSRDKIATGHLEQEFGLWYCAGVVWDFGQLASLFFVSTHTNMEHTLSLFLQKCKHCT